MLCAAVFAKALYFFVELQRVDWFGSDFERLLLMASPLDLIGGSAPDGTGTINPIKSIDGIFALASVHVPQMKWERKSFEFNFDQVKFDFLMFILWEKKSYRLQRWS